MQSSLAPGNMATPTGGGAQESPGGAGAVVRESAGLTLVSYFVYLQDKAAPPSCTRYTLLSPPLIAVTEAWCGCRAKVYTVGFCETSCWLQTAAYIHTTTPSHTPFSPQTSLACHLLVFSIPPSTHPLPLPPSPSVP